MEQRMVEMKEMKTVVWLVVGRVESWVDPMGEQLAVLRDNSMGILSEPPMADWKDNSLEYWLVELTAMRLEKKLVDWREYRKAESKAKKMVAHWEILSGRHLAAQSVY
jgi:hypothetical protein